MEEKLYFYYTNDLHSHFESWPQVVTFLENEKRQRIDQNESFWLVDIGDHLDRVHPITEATMGRANIELLNEAGYDLITLGNNEGITLPYQNLYHLYDQATFKVVCTNLKSLTEKNPHWLQPTATIQSKQGIKIGIIGLTAPFNAFYHLLGWHVEYPYEALDQQIEALNETTDVIVLLSHLGISEDRQIAERYENIDVIIGGHTHHLLGREEKVNQTIITAAGKNCTHVGEIILTWDHEQQAMVKKEAYAINITHLPKDEHTDQLLKKYEKEARDKLQQPVAQINTPLEVDWFDETELIQKLTHVLKKWTKTDVAMLNAGLLLESLEAGMVTHQDIHRICPHPINPCVVELYGDELLEIVRASCTDAFMNFELKGFGFRGKVIGKMVYDGIDVETDINHDGTPFIKNVTYCGEPLKSDRTYSIATADMFTFGRLIPEIAKASQKTYFLPEFLRDLLKYTLRIYY